MDDFGEVLATLDLEFGSFILGCGLIFCGLVGGLVHSYYRAVSWGVICTLFPPLLLVTVCLFPSGYSRRFFLAGLALVLLSTGMIVLQMVKDEHSSFHVPPNL